uniref:G-protein coupled receptors family 1 profile domain-containing protein n=1 Tax=Eptatretus burgeri TaxID=7764 RepID=A0A8C4NE06_EPTBU
MFHVLNQFVLLSRSTTFANQSLPPGMFLLKTMFREPSSVRLLAFCTFLLIYIIAFVGNFMLIVLIVWEKQLHKPVYIFLANLAATDLMGTSAALPRVIPTIKCMSRTPFPSLLLKCMAT